MSKVGGTPEANDSDDPLEVPVKGLLRLKPTHLLNFVQQIAFLLVAVEVFHPNFWRRGEAVSAAMARYYNHGTCREDNLAAGGRTELAVNDFAPCRCGDGSGQNTWACSPPPPGLIRKRTYTSVHSTKDGCRRQGGE